MGGVCDFSHCQVQKYLESSHAATPKKALSSLQDGLQPLAVAEAARKKPEAHRHQKSQRSGFISSSNPKALSDTAKFFWIRSSNPARMYWAHHLTIRFLKRLGLDK